MDFELTPEQREIQAVAREFADGRIAPDAAAWDRAHGFPRVQLRARRPRCSGSRAAISIETAIPYAPPRASGDPNVTTVRNQTFQVWDEIYSMGWQ